ncbi:hypothetical protein GGR52DRAFT_575337 [Hypoxylon sp. FL1284]|nr:hypothetical protein GGR52DRAFT_575337 [Hypoxylon sp. FL1284]
MDLRGKDSHASIVTCLNVEEHGCDIKDYMLHYLGCLKMCEREEFFDESKALWREEIEHQKTLCGDPARAEEIVKAKRQVWESNCRSELRRIDFLRKTLARDEDDQHLVKQLSMSSHRWRHSRRRCPSKDSINDVYGCPKSQDKPGSSAPNSGSEESTAYEPEKDANVPIIQIENGEGVEIPTEDGRVWNEFPNQKTTVQKLLYDEDSFLHRRPSSKTLRYFHIPSNNMVWAEASLAKLFRGTSATRGRITMQLIESCCGKIKHGRTWFFGNPTGEAEYMAAKSKAYHTRDTYVLSVLLYPLMPYLHWEISRKREQFAVEIEDIMNLAKADTAEQDKLRRQSQITKRGSAQQEAHQTNDGTKYFQRPTGKSIYTTKILTMTDLLKQLELIKSKLDVDDNGRVKVRSPLGQFFLDAARLYEGMSNYRDKRLLRKYLTTDPPLHPRRTLDQAYYWTLNSTKKRDRDQVVYRSTTTKPDDFHTYDRTSKNEDKLSRVVMVDQLWMWILDANTIITCFPKRYGANKHDVSGVHQSIRMRLQENASDVHAIFDLALIIIDECSGTFFDRTRTTDRQPLVMDIFSKAIGAVMYKQTAAFDRLWRWTTMASSIYHSRGSPDTSELHVPLLDIAPEGKLEREIKDIIEELEIMLHINRTHKRILTTFIANAENVLNPFGELGSSQKREPETCHHWAEARFRGSPGSRSMVADDGDDDDDDTDSWKEAAQRADDYNWFKLNADDKLQDVLARIEELEELRSSACNTAEGVKDLLELKQQQASVVQAWQAVKQSEESIRQGHSIMMFTIVTIVFLPLSFMSSVFGMNNSDITSDNASIKEEFVYMFSVAAGVILLSLVLGFGSWIRAAMFWLWKCTWTPVAVKLGLYGLWLDVDTPAREVYRSANEITDRLKEPVRIARFERRRREREAKDKRKGEAER